MNQEYFVIWIMIQDYGCLNNISVTFLVWFGLAYGI